MGSEPVTGWLAHFARRHWLKSRIRQLENQLPPIGKILEEHRLISWQLDRLHHELDQLDVQKPPRT